VVEAQLLQPGRAAADRAAGVLTQYHERRAGPVLPAQVDFAAPEGDAIAVRAGRRKARLTVHRDLQAEQVPVEREHLAEVSHLH
jgi:hypothetical protein